jgi:hypothetical protein
MKDEDASGHYVPLRDQPQPADHFPVTVLMRSTPTPAHPWIAERWDVVGMVTAREATAVRADAPAPAEESAERIVRFDGLILKLFPDEAESYYHNLTAPCPRCFVVCRVDDAGRPVPVVVTASFDRANAYVEGDERVEAVALPADLYPAIEAFVLTHFVPTERSKRKRKNWKTDDR